MPEQPKPGGSLLVLGPSGAGKSTLIRSALLAEQGGVVVMAPGDDEAMSYDELRGDVRYVLQGFDDTDFLPSIGERKADGFAKAMRFIRALYKQTLERWEQGQPPKYPVLAVDTVSGIAQLAVNLMLSRTGLQDAPPAMSPEGSRYYGGIRNLLEEFMRPCRALKGLGVEVIMASHVTEKKVSDTALAEKTKSTAHMPLITGSYREALPAVFDLTVHAGVDQRSKLRHYVQWEPDADRITKSRAGPLSSDERLPNDWQVLKPLVKQALQKRAQAAKVAAQPGATTANAATQEAKQ